MGVQFISSVGDNFSVVNGQLIISSTPSFDQVLATSNGLGTNVKIGDDGWLGDVNLANTINIKGLESDSEGYISFGQNGSLIDSSGQKNQYIGSNGTDLTLGSTNDIILHPGSNYAYIGTPLQDGSNRIAQISDITNVDLHIVGTDNQISVNNISGTSTISLPSYIDIPNGEMHLRKTEYWKDGDQFGVIVSNPYSNHFNVVSVGRDLELESQNGYNIILNSSGGYVDATSAEIHSKKTEYWLDGQNRGALLAHPSDGSVTLAATGWLHIESHDGAINIDPDNGSTNFNGNIRITNDGYIIAENSDLTLGSDNSTLNLNVNYINATNNNSEMHLRKTEYWNDGTQYGIVTNNGNEFKLVSTQGDIVLDSHSGNVHIPSTLHVNEIDFNGDGGYAAYAVVNGNTDMQLDSEYNLIIRAWDGEVQLASGNGTTVFSVSDSNDAQSPRPIDSSTTIVTDNTNLTVNAEGNISLVPGGIVDASGAEFHTKKIELWNNGTQYGILADNSNTFKVVSTAGNLVLESHSGTIEVQGSLLLDSNINANGYTVENVPNPTNGTDVANKQYVDAVAQGINIHTSADATTTADLNANYANGSTDADGGLGIGATLTSKTNGVISIDGYTTSPTSNPGLVVGSRILVKDQNDLKQNGVYVITTLGDTNNPWVLTRADDYNNSVKDQVIAGDFVFVSFGNTQANTAWVQINEGVGTDHSIKIGTDEMYFTQFAGAGTYTANQGVKVDGNTFQLNPSSTGGLATDSTYAYIKLRTDSGLSTTSNGLAVNAGTGIIVSGANVSVDTSTIATRLYADGVASTAQSTAESYTDTQIAAQSYVVEIDGNGTNNSFTVNHNLGTRDVIVRVYQTSVGPDTQYADIEVDIVRTDTNNVTIGFASAPSNVTTYRVVVIK